MDRTNFKHKKIYISKSRIDGFGLFASKDIKNGETVAIIKGKLVHWVVKDMKTAMYGEDWIGIKKNLWIDPAVPFKYLNHSCHPNSAIKGAVTVVALKHIKQGEEITLDYSTIESEKLWYMRCLCKSDRCRKVVRSVQFLPKSFFDNYLPHIPKFFQTAYHRHHANKRAQPTK